MYKLIKKKLKSISDTRDATDWAGAARDKASSFFVKKVYN